MEKRIRVFIKCKDRNPDYFVKVEFRISKEATVSLIVYFIEQLIKTEGIVDMINSQPGAWNISPKAYWYSGKKHENNLSFAFSEIKED